jgi:hypothetical protein
MGILSFLGGAIKPLTQMVDELHTSDEERLTLKHAITTLHNSMAEKSLDYESKLVEARSSIIIAEAQSPIWITAAWRPITMLTFVGLIVWSQFSGAEIPPDLWFVIKLGLGGYVGGRSAEKIVPGVIEALKKKEEA